jgi:hippurate hydrolase
MHNRPVLPGIQKIVGEMIAIRRHMHAYPELSLKETATSALVAEKLEQWGYEVHRGIGVTGVVGVLRQGTGSKMLGIRADMDALPIPEQTGLPYGSQHSGVMHACGHDGHTAMLLAASRCVADTRQFDGTLVVIFQPAEESDDGAQKMLDDGLLKRFPCDVIFGMHNMPGMPVGKLGFRSGPSMASTDTLKIKISGAGGHGAMPHKTVDPILVGACIVSALQSIVSRNTDPMDTAVITVGSFHAGGAPNVIPDHAELQLSVRALRPKVRDNLIQRIDQLVHAQALSFGAKAAVEIVAGQSLPPLINDLEATNFARKVAVDWLGEQEVILDMPAIAASEDFAVMLQACPGCYLFIGNGEDGPSLHSAEYDFNDQSLGTGASYWVRLVEKYLAL